MLPYHFKETKLSILKIDALSPECVGEIVSLSAPLNPGRGLQFLPVRVEYKLGLSTGELMAHCGMVNSLFPMPMKPPKESID